MRGCWRFLQGLGMAEFSKVLSFGLFMFSLALTCGNPIWWELTGLPVEVGLEMYGEKPVVLPFFTGYVSRGLLLHILRRVDPVLAGVLHEADRPKPYSVTPLRFKSVEKSEKGYLMDCSP
jgi:hypothetical protein